jgi:8-oxo-dGTP diphosphatase
MKSDIKYSNSDLPVALVAVDICIFKIIDNSLCVYLTTVKNDYYQGMLCLPGSLISLTETAEETAKRVIETRTTLKQSEVYREQLYSFSDINRDKRSRAVAVAYLGLYSGGDNEGFVDIKKIPKLAYDHNEIVKVAKERLVSKLEYTSLIQKLIKDNFTFSELQKAYEIVLGRGIDKRNFRKKINGLDIVKETGVVKKEGRMRPAKEYKFKSDKVQSFKMFGEI